MTLPLAGGPLQVGLRPRPAQGVWEIEVRGVGTGVGSLLRRLRKAMPEGGPYWTLRPSSSSLSSSTFQ